MGDVSRETVPPPEGDVVRQIFPADRLPLVERYAELLATEGVTRGLIGPREVPRIWDRHLVNCGLVARLVPEGATVSDLGSGAGLPGLVLALARPDLRVTLIEPMARRTAFLDEAVADLGLGQVVVLRMRAEAWSGSERFDVVTARALAPLERLLGWALPLVDPHGQVLAMKGSSAAEEIAAAAPVLRRAGAAAEVVRLEIPGASHATVVRVVGAEGAALGWPPAKGAGRRGRDR